MNNQTAKKSTQVNKINSSFVIFLLALFVFTSCPVKLTFLSFVSSSQTQQQQKVKQISNAPQLVNYSVSTCKAAISNVAENVSLVFETPQFKTTSVLISLFAITLAFCIALLSKVVGNFSNFRKALPASPLYVRNCTLLI